MKVTVGIACSVVTIPFLLSFLRACGRDPPFFVMSTNEIAKETSPIKIERQRKNVPRPQLLLVRGCHEWA